MADKKIAADNEVPVPLGPVEIDPKIYNQIAKCADLLAVQLIDSHFTISPSFFDEKAKGKLQVEFADIHSSYDEESRVSTCIFAFESYKKFGRRKVFSVRDKFVVFYRISSDCDDVHAIAFTRKTGLMACYPYFRSHVAQTAALANAEMPILPTIASMPIKEKVKKEEG